MGVRELRAAICAKHLLGLQRQTFQIVLSMNTAFCQQLLPDKKAFASQWSDSWCCCRDAFLRSRPSGGGAREGSSFLHATGLAAEAGAMARDRVDLKSLF